MKAIEQTADVERAAAVEQRAGVERATDASMPQRSVVLGTAGLLRRQVPLLACALPLIWLALLPPAALNAALGLVEQVSGSWLHAAVAGLRTALVVLQVVLIVAAFAGLQRGLLSGLRTGRRTQPAAILSCGREAWWLFGWAVVAWIAYWQVVAWRQSPDGQTASLALLAGTIVPAMVVVLLIVVAVLSAFAPVAALIADRQVKIGAAVAQTARLLATRAHLKHVAPALFAAALTLAAFVTPVWMPGSTGADISDTPGPTLHLLAHFPWLRAGLVATVVWLLCIVAAALSVSLYGRLVGSARPDAAVTGAAAAATTSELGLATTSDMARRRWRRVAATAAVLLAAVSTVAVAWSAGLDSSSRTVPPGARVGLQSGVSLVAPHDTATTLVSYGRYPSWLPFQENMLVTPVFTHHIDDSRHLISGHLDGVSWQRPCRGAETVWADSFSSEHAVVVRLAESDRLLAATPDGTVAVHVMGTSWLQIVTHLPGRPAGVVTIVVDPKMTAQRVAVARRVWRLLDIRGASLPTTFTR